MALPDGGAAVFAVATRITQLNGNGEPEANGESYTTENLLECTFAPVLEAGDDIAHKNAAGNLAVFTKHGDMPKYYDVTINFAYPDPNIEAILCGGVVYEDKSVAFGVQEKATLVAKATGGTLSAAAYAYELTARNQYGETAGSTEATVTTTGASSQVLIKNTKPIAGNKATSYGVYGREAGNLKFLGTLPEIGEPECKAIAAETIVSIGLEKALTIAIPAGTTFSVSGDAANQVFTTSAAVPVGATAIPVVSQVATVVAAKGKAQATFVDNGAITPSVPNVPVSDTTAGPGKVGVGYQAPALGFPGPNTFSLELYEKAIVGGSQATYLPYWRVVIPGCKNFVVESRDAKNDMLANKFKGQAFVNPSWGSGPFGDWQFDSTKVVQRARCSAQILPAVGFANTPATR